MKESTQFVASDIIARHAKSLYHRLSRDLKMVSAMGLGEEADAHFLKMIEKEMTRSVVNCYQYRDSVSISPLKEKSFFHQQESKLDVANYNAIIVLENQGNASPTEADIEHVTRLTERQRKSNDAVKFSQVVTPLLSTVYSQSKLSTSWRNIK